MSPMIAFDANARFRDVWSHALIQDLRNDGAGRMWLDRMHEVMAPLATAGTNRVIDIGSEPGPTLGELAAQFSPTQLARWVGEMRDVLLPQQKIYLTAPPAGWFGRLLTGMVIRVIGQEAFLYGLGQKATLAWTDDGIEHADMSLHVT